MADRGIMKAAFGVGDQASAFAVGAPDPDALNSAAYLSGDAAPKVTGISVVPCSIAGFYIIIIMFDDDHTRQFMVSPATLITELGDEIPEKPKLVVARTKFDGDIN